jgi:hypothetical protein
MMRPFYAGSTIMDRIFSRATLAMVAATLLALSAVGAQAEPSKKWRIKLNHRVDNDATVVFRVSPVGGTPIDVETKIPAGTGENKAAKMIRDSFQVSLGEGLSRGDRRRRRRGHQEAQGHAGVRTRAPELECGRPHDRTEKLVHADWKQCEQGRSKRSRPHASILRAVVLLLLAGLGACARLEPRPELPVEAAVPAGSDSSLDQATAEVEANIRGSPPSASSATARRPS